MTSYNGLQKSKIGEKSMNIHLILNLWHIQSKWSQNVDRKKESGRERERKKERDREGERERREVCLAQANVTAGPQCRIMKG